ncbi:MAG: T9SS type A sorting domain-containing protein [Calditrichae bacterium]|nr:T9SS type A sorting domain-containing protein [Calditrichia bacterium]
MKPLLIILLITTTILAQQHLLLKPDNTTEYLSTPEMKKRQLSKVLNIAPEKVLPYDERLEGVTGIVDTLRYADKDDPKWNSNFGFFGQDVIVQPFVAPADMLIKGISFDVREGSGQQVSVKLVSMNWNENRIRDAGVQRLGYYPAPGNGFNDAEPFLDNDRGIEVGDWIDVSDSSWGSPFGNDLWSDDGAGEMVYIDAPGEYWIDLRESDLWVLAGCVFGVAVKNLFTTMDSSRVGLTASNSLNFPGFKYYANGRFSESVGSPDTASIGWWAREFTFNMSVAAELSGCRPPYINLLTVLRTTLSTEPRTVRVEFADDNPSGGLLPEDTLFLHYWNSIDDDWTKVLMTETDDYIFEAQIPGFPAGTEVQYYCQTELVNPPCGNAQTQTVSYYIFEPKSPTLLFYDANDFSLGTIKAYWMAGVDTFTAYDVWMGDYGPISSNLLQYYNSVIHLMGSMPLNTIDSTGRIYKNWLGQASAQNPRNLFISGQDYGYISEFADTTFPPGSFERDYLGIETLGPQDVSWDSTIETVQVPYPVIAVTDDPLSGWINQYNSDSTVFVNDPYFNLGYNNWIDNMTLDQAQPVFTDGKTGLPVACRHEGEGWKTTFWTVDPLALAFSHKTDSAQVIWLWDKQNPMLPVLSWFGFTPTAMEDIKSKYVPDEFALKQNYPNPFNPATVISYKLKVKSDIRLVVYDALGRLVNVLVKGSQPAGSYYINFDASGLASGVYYYRLQAGAFVQTRKMLLLR